MLANEEALVAGLEDKRAPRQARLIEVVENLLHVVVNAADALQAPLEVELTPGANVPSASYEHIPGPPWKGVPWEYERAICRCGEEQQCHRRQIQ